MHYFQKRVIILIISALISAIGFFNNNVAEAKEPDAIVSSTAFIKALETEIAALKQARTLENEQVLKATYLEKDLDPEKEMIESIQAKLGIFSINRQMEMRERVGFTVNEFKYILTHLQIPKRNEALLKIEEEELATRMALSMIVAMRKYEVNELIVISIMARETGWMRGNSAAIANNNFGGLKKHGELLSYANVETGIDKYVLTISNNLGESFLETANLYCRETAERNQQWADSVYNILEEHVALEIMKW